MKTYFTLALLALIFAILSGLFGVIIGAGVSAFHNKGEGGMIIGLCIAAIIFAVIGFFFAVIGMKNPKLFGILMVIIGIFELLFMTLFGVLPMVLFITSGVMMYKEHK